LRGLRTGAWWEIGSCGDVAGSGLLDHLHRAMILMYSSEGEIMRDTC
jgi:hypothetical protein